jgi:hypothetical protein
MNDSVGRKAEESLLMVDMVPAVVIQITGLARDLRAEPGCRGVVRRDDNVADHLAPAGSHCLAGAGSSGGLGQGADAADAAPRGAAAT